MQTPNTFAHKFAYLQNRAWLPPTLLLLALSSVFLFGNEYRGYFQRGGHHDQTSAKNMGIVEHLSLEHRFLMFRGQTVGADGESEYWLYNRFPIGIYALIKLATLPFDDYLPVKTYAARVVMLTFFTSATVFAYLSLRRLAASRWIALTATLLAFASPSCLYYSDVITGEAMVDVFAVLLVFHGMVIFEQEKRFLQLPIKACIALLLGWHVYAILLPFIVFGLTREFIKARSAVSTTSNTLHQLKHVTLSLARSRYFAVGAIALFFGISVLAFNFTNEYLALNREIPLTEVPSFESMMKRTGAAPRVANELIGNLSWTTFLERQFYRIGIMSLPYAFSPSYVLERMATYNFVYDADSIRAPRLLFAVLGVAVFGAVLIGLARARRHKILLTTLALSGFCWALPMRYTTAFPNHNFESIFYIGVTLTLFSLILLWLHERWGERSIAALAVAALPVFIISAWQVAQPIYDAETSDRYRSMASDLESVYNMTQDGASIFLSGVDTTKFIAHFRSRVIIHGYLTAPSARPPDFIVTNGRPYGPTSLTPQNRILFLYEWDDRLRYLRDIYHSRLSEFTAQAVEPLIRSNFDVYLDDNSLLYVKDHCQLNDTKAIFFLALYPADERDLSSARRQHGFDNLDFYFPYRGIRIGERCIATYPLPEYDIARIYTGQYIYQPDGSFEHLWEGEARLSEVAH